MKVLKQVNLESTAGELLDFDPQKATQVVGEASTAHRTTLQHIKGRGHGFGEGEGEGMYLQKLQEDIYQNGG